MNHHMKQVIFHLKHQNVKHQKQQTLKTADECFAIYQT